MFILADYYSYATISNSLFYFSILIFNYFFPTHKIPSLPPLFPNHLCSMKPRTILNKTQSTMISHNQAQ